MKAVLTSVSFGSHFELNDFYCAQNSYEFVSPVNNKGWRSDSRIEVKFLNLQETLFEEIRCDDEFEIEIVLHRKPKTPKETKTFK